MTEKQSVQLVKNPNTKKAMTVLTAFAKLETHYKQMEKAAKEAAEQIKDAMIEAGVQRIDGEWGYITLAERTNYKAEDLEAIDQKYLKFTLDTTKVKAEATLTGKLPKGVVESKTQYITKKLKEV